MIEIILHFENLSLCLVVCNKNRCYTEINMLLKFWEGCPRNRQCYMRCICSMSRWPEILIQKVASFLFDIIQQLHILRLSGYFVNVSKISTFLISSSNEILLKSAQLCTLNMIWYGRLNGKEGSVLSLTSMYRPQWT